MFFQHNIKNYFPVKLFILIFILLSFSVSTEAIQIKIEGIYRGENLYIMNPFSASGIGFCVSEVRVNGQLTTDEINSSAFEIDFAPLGLKLGDNVKVEIFHKDGCVPKILNPEVLKPKSTFILQHINADKSGILKWATTDEKGVLDYEVEQFRWNKWIIVGKVKGKGTPESNVYSYKINFHSGLNKFRVKQTDYSNKPRISAEAKYNSLSPEITFTPGNGKYADKEITFSGLTDFEIYNFYGSLIRKGRSTKIDVSKLKKGSYYLNYDNKTAVFNKK